MTNSDAAANSRASSEVGSEGELRVDEVSAGRVGNREQGVGGVDVVDIEEPEEQVIGGDVDTGGSVDGEVLGETDDDLELVVQPRQIEGRQEVVADGVVEVGVDGVEAVGGVVVQLPVETEFGGQVERLEVLLEGQEHRAEAGGGGTDLVDPVAGEDEASCGALSLAVAGVHSDVVVGDVVAVEPVVGRSPEEGADITLDGEVNSGLRVSVGDVLKTVLNDVVASAEVIDGVGEELLTGKASRVGASATGLVVGLTGQRARRDNERAGGGVVSQAARVDGESGALAGSGVESGAAEAVKNSGALALTAVLVVGLRAGARGDGEAASGGGVGEAARVNGKGRALAGHGVEGGAARAGQNGRALALTAVLVVGLRAGARGDGEAASGDVVGEAARVNGKGRALAGGSVKGGTARASQGAGALTLARRLAIDLRSRARGNVEVADGGVVNQAALMSRVSRACASGRLEAGTAETVGGGSVRTLAITSRSAVDLGSVASRDNEGAGGGVKDQAARASGVSRAGAGSGVEGGTAEASGNGGALAGARGLVVGLRAWAIGDGERAGEGGVGETARVSGQGVALASVGVETDTARASQDIGALALASVLVVGLRSGARGDGEGAGVDVVSQAADVGREGRALAGDQAEGGAARAGLDRSASARARGLVVELRKVASGNREGAVSDVVNQAARVSGVSRAGAGSGVEGGTAEASGNGGALAGARGLVVHLRVRATGDGERAGGSGVGETARVSGQGVALASVGVETDTAGAGQDGSALALASVLVVGLRSGARGDGEGAVVDVVSQAANRCGEGRALAGDWAESGGARAGLNGSAAT